MLTAAVRAVALLVILAAPLWSGCFGGGADEDLAKPTDKPVSVPPTRPTPPTPARFNTSDPGYRVEAPWRIGDAWDYESEKGNIRRVRVLDLRLMNDTTKFMVETTRVASGGEVQSVNVSWVEPRGWLLLNDTDASGAGDRYEPGMPLRFWRNSSVTFEHDRLARGGALLSNETVTIHSRLFPTHQTLLFPWGYVEAKRVEHLHVTRHADGSRSERTIVHWVHRDYLNDIQFQLPDGETFTLTAARAGDFRRGQPA